MAVGSLATRRNVLQMKYLGYSDEEIASSLSLTKYDVEQVILRAAQAEADSFRINAVREAELVKLEQLDEVFLPQALEGSMKAARFVLDVAKRRAALVGADQQPTLSTGPTFNLVQILATLSPPPRQIEARLVDV